MLLLYEFLPLLVVAVSVGPTSTEPLKVISGIDYPTSIATGHNGEVIVASYMGHKVHVYDSDHKPLHTFGSNGFMDGQFMCPSGVAVDRLNRIYVSSMSKMDMFTMEGQFLNAVGQSGNGQLQFQNAASIAVSRKGMIYVADTQNNRIQVLNPDLTFCSSFSAASPKLGSGRLCQPQAVAINSEGNIYVADMMNHAVQAFSPDGSYLLSFGTYGPPTNPGSVCSPMSIAIDRQDNVFIGSSTGTIGIFDKQGNFLRQFGSHGSQLGQFYQIRGLHIDRKGHLYVSEWMSNRIQIFSCTNSMEDEEEEEEEESKESIPDLVETSKPAYLIGPKSTSPSKILSDIKASAGIAVGANGETVVASFNNHKVLVYSSENNYQLMTEIGGEGFFDGHFIYPSGVAVTPDNLMIVTSRNKVQWFTMDGQLVCAVGGKSKAEMEFDVPTDVTVGRDGRVYVLDSENKRIQILNGDATYHGSFDLPHIIPEENNAMCALAINSEDNLYITDSNKHCIHVYSSDGKQLFKFGKSGAWIERGVLISPMAVAVDDEDNVFVGSVMMISIFDKSGTFIRAFGGPGDQPGQFSLIKGLHIDRKGNVYVSEFSNNRVQIFEGSELTKSNKEVDDTTRVLTLSARRPAHMFGPKSTSPMRILTEIAEANDVAEGKNGEVIVISQKERQVFVYDSKRDYQRVAEIGGSGKSEGKIISPSGVAVTSDNLVLVSSRHKLQWFTTDGKLVYAVGEEGNEPLKFKKPRAIAINKEGEIYVLDEENRRVQILNGDGTYHGSFGFPHLPNPKEEPPCALAINSEGNVYFADSKNDRIRVFSPNGEPLFTFGKSGSWTERGTQTSPKAITIDAQDNVIVADHLEKISVFDKSGNLIRDFGGSGKDAGKFKGIRGICSGKNGSLYVSEYGNNRVQIFEGNQSNVEVMCDPIRDIALGDVSIPSILSSRRPFYTIGPSSDKPLKILSNIADPWGVATAPNGDLFVVSKSEKKVLVYDSRDFEFKEEIDKFYWETSRDNQIADPTSIAVCHDGCLLVSLKNQLVKVNASGEVIASVGNKGRSGRNDNELNSPSSVTLGKDGRVYVVDKGNERVQIFNPELTYHSTCRLPEDFRGACLEKIAINSQENIFVTDSRNTCIHVFRNDGKFLFSFSKIGSSSKLVAIAIDHEDYVYACGSGGIFIFDREGCLVHTFGSSGHEPGEFQDVKAIHIDPNGHLFVCEGYKTKRIQIFTGVKPHDQGEKDRKAALDKEEAKLTATLPVTVIAEGIQEPRGIAEGRNGEIVVASCTDNRVFVYNHTCRLLVEFGGKGDVDGEFNAPTDVAVTSDNLILVSSRDRLQWFTMEGQMVYAIGNSGKEGVELNHPDSFTIDKDGKIYVLENQSKRVQIFKGDGAYHGSFSLKNYCPLGQIAVNSEGNIYITDKRNSCIRVFSSEGEYLSKFGNMGTKELAVPTAIAIDKKDEVYVSTVSGIVATFNKEGDFIGAFRGSGEFPGQFNIIKGLHVGKSGCVYIADSTNDCIKVFGKYEPSSNLDWDSTHPSSKILPHRPVYTVGPKSTIPAKILSGIKRPTGITSNPHGKIFIASEKDNKVLVYDSATFELHSQIAEINNPRDVRNKRISDPSGLAFTSDGYLLVSFEHQFVKMSLDGTVVKFFGNERNRRGNENREVDSPGGIALGKDGQVFLVDRGNHRVLILQSNLEYSSTYCNPDQRERSQEYLEDAALNSAGELYVIDRRKCEVQVFSKSGRFLFAFGKKCSRNSYIRGGLYDPHAVAIDHEDFVYVGGDDGVISIFDGKGKFVRSFGGSGDQPGRFGNIKGMHIDRRGQLYVSDWKNDRLQVFK